MNNKFIAFLGLVFLSFLTGCFGTLSRTYDVTEDGRGNYSHSEMNPLTLSQTGRTNVEMQQGLIDRCLARYQNHTYELRPVTLPNGHSGVIAIQRPTLAGDHVAQCNNGIMHGIPMNNPSFWGGGVVAPSGGYGYGGYQTSHGMMRLGAPGFYKSLLMNALNTLKDLF